MLYTTICILSLSAFTLAAADEESTSVANGCNSLEDGEQWIRFVEGTRDDGVEYPNVKVMCSGGYAILDYNLDANIQYYFSTFSSWTEYAASSELNDRVTWTDWFLPYSDGDKFLIAEDCSTCTSTDNYGELSTYFMTGNYIGCLWGAKGYCDMDPDTLECYTCSAGDFTGTYNGLCSHVEASADTEVYTEHDMCTGYSWNLEPSIGTNGQYCVCYQSSADESTMVTAATWTETSEDYEEEEEQSPDTEILLTSDDFLYGTYRITQPGTYIIQEDIEFNFNAPETWDSPNAEGYWYPQEEQDDTYEGAKDFVGAYSMGFFAGIAIESHDVTIDLNGHTLKMAPEFHLQQRWFALIELGSKAFISGQGPGNFGAFLTQPSSIVIKNGVLGLSCHHGIHGNGADGITIQDLVIKDFEVAGVALNGFTDAVLENVEIGPSYQSVPVLGVYTQARVLLPRLRAAIEEECESDTDCVIEFHDRGEVTAVEIEESLVTQMDMVFKYALEDATYDDDDETWAAAKKLFINDLKIPSASVVMGVFLNALGASVFAIGGAPGTSSNAVIKNVYVHDLINDPWEVPRVMATKGPMNDIVDVTRVSDNGLSDLTTAQYLGSAYTDAQYALYKISSNWALLSHAIFKSSVQSWISDGEALGTSTHMKCNNDIMLHVTKGVFGFRMDNIDNFEIETLKVENLQNLGYYGSSVCGEYESENDGGHRNQKYPVQRGYTGTEAHGITMIGSTGSMKDITVGKVISARGDAFGMQIFPSNEVTLGSVTVSDIHAGAYAKTTDSELQSLPNKTPRSCAISMWTYADDDYSASQVTYDASEISASCVTGHTTCGDSDFDYELVSSVNDCSIESGNLIDSGIETGYVYAAIGEYSDDYQSMVEKLDYQTSFKQNEFSTSATVIAMAPKREETSSSNVLGRLPLWSIIVMVGILMTIALVGVYKISKNRKASSLLDEEENKRMLFQGLWRSEYTPLLDVKEAAKKGPSVISRINTEDAAVVI